MYEHFIIDDELYIFIQLASGGSLSNLIRKKKPFSETQSKKWFAQIVSGVNHLHLKKVADRDLKLRNILIGDNNELYISDFGLSRVALRQIEGKSGVRMPRTFCGTAPYMAPEILIHNFYNPFDADIWALGVIHFVLLNRSYPFNFKDKDKMLRSQLKHKWEFTHHLLQKPSEEC